MHVVLVQGKFICYVFVCTTYVHECSCSRSSPYPHHGTLPLPQTCASTVLYASCMHSLTSSPRSGHSVQCLYPKNIRVFPDKPNCDSVTAVCSDSSCPVCVCDTQHTHIIIHLCPSITHVFLKPLLMSCGGTFK